MSFQSSFQLQIVQILGKCRHSLPQCHRKGNIGVGSGGSLISDVQMLCHWLVICCHGNCLFQLPIWSEPNHSTNLLNLWFFGKRNPGQGTALQGQLILCELPLLNVHQTSILCIYERHMVCTRFQSNEATLSVKRLVSF